jgi:hypothetical protein
MDVCSVLDKLLAEFSLAPAIFKSHPPQKEAGDPTWVRNRSGRTTGPPDRAAGTAGGGRGLDRKLRSDGLPIYYLRVRLVRLFGR